MKEILLKFETEELYQEFIEMINEILSDQDGEAHLEYDFQNNIGIISNNKLKK